MSDISLRDYFAGLAMQAILTNKTGNIKGEYVADMAYNMAGHMINERNKHLKERHKELCDSKALKELCND